jgi:hypothetical protein
MERKEIFTNGQATAMALAQKSVLIFSPESAVIQHKELTETGLNISICRNDILAALSSTLESNPLPDASVCVSATSFPSG